MLRFHTSLVLLLALGLSMGDAMALGFGRVSSGATLGSPLSFTVGLRMDPAETIESRCVKAEVSFGDRQLAEAQVQARIETATGSGERRVKVTTSTPVDEPVVNVVLHMGCASTLSGSFPVFADPPMRAAVVAPSPGAGDESWSGERTETPVSGVVAAVPPTQPAAGRASRPAQPARKTASVARPRGQAAAEAKASPGPVLKLDPVEADALIFPSLQLATKLSEPARADGAGAPPRFADPEYEQRQRELERIKAMEATLLTLRTESAATQKALAEMQLRVREAEAGRYANPLVYLLTILCCLLGAGLVAMWWLRRRDRRAAGWWAPGAGAAAAASRVSTRGAGELDIPDLSEPQPMPSAPMPAPRSEAAPPLFAPLAASSNVSTPGALSESAEEPRRPMSAEELIDLEQQAEFFVVLGQDEAAIDLLMGHVRSTGGVSPLPYLKLLEIYRRRDEREQYDRMRERFNRRFNAYAPEWGVDPETGLSLDGYPEVMSRIEKAWAAPSRAMDLLDSSLFRRDAGPTFDVPAYRELLFLYGVARDLAEHDAGPGDVDLLLPFDDSGLPSTYSNLSPTPGGSTAGPPPSAFAPLSLDLDVSSDRPPLFTLEERSGDLKKTGR